MAGVDYDEVAVMDEDVRIRDPLDTQGTRIPERSPLSKVRSLSDGGGTQLSPSPLIIEASRRTSKDDSSLRDRVQDTAPAPVTPRRPDFPLRGLSLQMPPRDSTSPAPQPSPFAKPTPLSPKLDHSHIYASPTNILPRRSRGLDFSRAATSLHHSTLAEQASPDSSPTIGGRGMNIPGRGNGESGRDPSSLWSMMGNQERMNISSSLGSTNPLASDSSSSSDDDDLLDDEMEDAILTTPQVVKGNAQGTNQGNNGVPWLPGTSPAMTSLASFRTRPRKQSKRKTRGLASLGFNAAAPPVLSKSPPNNVIKEIRDIPISHSRRESISWAANQLHISSSENEDRAMDTNEGMSTPSREGARGVIRRAVTRRGNLLPKTKGFARIRAALAEENTPVDYETRREAEVIRQVRESDMDLEPRIPPGPPPPLDTSNIPTANSSPNLTTVQDTVQESPDDIPTDDMMTDGTLSSSFKQHAMKNSKGKNFWETFSEASSGAGTRVTPPPPAFMPRGSSSGISEDVNMDSPSLSSANSVFTPGAGLAIGTGSDSQRSETPQQAMSAPASQAGSVPPTAADITRRINNKRRRDDDFDPNSFKRRAVSPGMSVHNSPIMQSPLQRDPWGSRPGSNHGGDNSKFSCTPSDNGASTPGNNNGGGGTAPRPINAAKGRVGFQGMVDTNDGLMRMSIE
ncbi:hypothetical protein F4778DRAFT_537005 [Xylariomycetidae sp. FL2044]|nr:hypothetical protein F4778DRAFT_537005 [Xylariomycetidae sp. FL2044]